MGVSVGGVRAPVSFDTVLDTVLALFSLYVPLRYVINNLIFEGKRVKPKLSGDSQAEALGAGMLPGRSWWKRGDVT